MVVWKFSFIFALLNHNLKQIKNVKNINIFMGCDSNEPDGKFLQQINKEPFNINDKDINFNINSEFVPNTCCANCNSVTQNPQVTAAKCGPTGNFNKQRFDHVTNEKNYTEGFYLPSNFAFKGDYVLYGTSNVDFNSRNESVIEVDNRDEIYYKDASDKLYKDQGAEIIVSDHYPVKLTFRGNVKGLTKILGFNPQALGGKSRRRRVTKRKNKRRSRKNRRKHR